MSDMTKSPSDDEKKDDGKKQPTGKRRVLILATAAIALIALLVAASVLIPSFGGPYDGEQAVGQQTSIEDPVTADDDEEDATQEEACTHDWTVTYKTIHHDAVTHTETIEPVYGEETTYHTVCNECEQVIDGIADQHIKDTGHSGYSTNVPITDEVIVSEGYTREVTDTPAYDETVADELVCTICGALRPLNDTIE